MNPNCTPGKGRFESVFRPTQGELCTSAEHRGPGSGTPYVRQPLGQDHLKLVSEERVGRHDEALCLPPRFSALTLRPVLALSRALHSGATFQDHGQRGCREGTVTTSDGA